MDFELFNKNISETLDDHAIYISGEHRRTLEDEVWRCLQESVDHGWRTQDEADVEFAEWRAKYLPIGKVALQ